MRNLDAGFTRVKSFNCLTIKQLVTFMTPQNPPPGARTDRIQDQHQRLVDLEQARIALIQEYQSHFAALRQQYRAIQVDATAPTPSPVLPPSPLLPRLPALAPGETDAQVPRRPTTQTILASSLGWAAAAFIVTWSVTTPQYVLSVIPHVPLYPLFLSLGLGLLLLLVTAWRRHPPAYRDAGVFSMLYALSVGGPFLLTWILCAQADTATWPAALAGLLGPSLLLIHRYRQSQSAGHHPDGGRVARLAHRWARVLTLPVSLFYGYGCVLLGTFLTTVRTPHQFGPLVVTHLGLLLLLGAALSAGIFSALYRAPEPPHTPMTRDLDPSLPELRSKLAS